MSLLRLLVLRRVAGVHTVVCRLVGGRIINGIYEVGRKYRPPRFYVCGGVCSRPT